MAVVDEGAQKIAFIAVIRQASIRPTQANPRSEPLGALVAWGLPLLGPQKAKLIR